MGILSFDVGAGTSQVLSLVLHANQCDWIVAKVKSKTRMTCQSVLASGSVQSNPLLFNETGQLTSVGFKAVLDAVTGQVSKLTRIPKGVVVTLPSIYSFQFELSVSKGEESQQIQFRIEDMLEEVSAGQGGGMVYDWQDKGVMDPETGERQVVVAAMRQDQLNVISSVCDGAGLKCVGLALDSQACVNGYVQASQLSKASKGGVSGVSKYLLLGYLAPAQVKLSIFIDGLLFSENVASQEHDFSLVQSLSALEKLVQSWTRGEMNHEDEGIALILAGPLAGAKGALSTASRSQSIGQFLIDVRPIPSLADCWHDRVTAFGALEGLPCE